MLGTGATPQLTSNTPGAVITTVSLADREFLNFWVYFPASRVQHFSDMPIADQEKCTSMPYDGLRREGGGGGSHRGVHAVALLLQRARLRCVARGAARGARGARAVARLLRVASLELAGPASRGGPPPAL